jgi:hypothetical protein
MLTLIVAGLVGLTVVFDFLPGIKKRPKKESVIYCLLLAVGFCVLLLYSLDVKVPGPSEWIRSVVEAIFPVK